MVDIVDLMCNVTISLSLSLSFSPPSPSARFVTFLKDASGKMTPFSPEVKSRDKFRPRIQVVACHDIEAGGELLLNYGDEHAPAECCCIKCAFVSNCKGKQSAWPNL